MRKKRKGNHSPKVANESFNFRCGAEGGDSWPRANYGLFVTLILPKSGIYPNSTAMCHEFKGIRLA